MMKYRKNLLKVGDMVKIITGSDKNKVGKIKSFDRKKGTIIVEGVNMKTHFPNKKEGSENKEIIRKEGPINISNAMILNEEGNITRLKRGPNGREAVKGKLA